MSTGNISIQLDQSTPPLDSSQRADHNGTTIVPKPPLLGPSLPSHTSRGHLAQGPRPRANSLPPPGLTDLGLQPLTLPPRPSRPSPALQALQEYIESYRRSPWKLRKPPAKRASPKPPAQGPTHSPYRDALLRRAPPPPQPPRQLVPLPVRFDRSIHSDLPTAAQLQHAPRQQLVTLAGLFIQTLTASQPDTRQTRSKQRGLVSGTNAQNNRGKPRLTASRAYFGLRSTASQPIRGPRVNPDFIHPSRRHLFSNASINPLNSQKAAFRRRNREVLH